MAYTELELSGFEEKLLDQQEQVLGITHLLALYTQPASLSQSSVGQLSRRMDAMQNQATAQLDSDRQAELLELIANALERIDEGIFGFCLVCGDLIPKGRLEAEPTTPHCLQCEKS